MANLIKRQLSDALGTLPTLEPLNPTKLGSGAQEDLFLCALGFEPRCLNLPGSLKDAGYTARRAVYFRYATNLDDNSVNLPALESHLCTISSKVEMMDADTTDFPNKLRSLLELTMSEAQEQPPRITLDISVTANRLLLRCVNVLLEYDVCLRIIYSEAAIYHPTESEYSQEPSKWGSDDELGLERGVNEVFHSIDHPGHGLDPLPDFVILFPSFKSERSKAVVSFVDPALLASTSGKVVWLLGVPHLDEDLWRLDTMKDINRIGDTDNQYEVSTFDYKETMQILERLYTKKSEEHTITVSPLGSKLQALGTALFCYIHPDVRVIFSTPKEYNAAQYSDGCKNIWALDFGNLHELRRNLNEVGKLRIEE